MFRMSERRIALSVVAWTCFAGAAQAQSVLIADAAGSPGSFADIQLAVDAAGEGDIILVRDGEYGAVSIHDKGVTLVADASGRPQIVALAVSGLAPSQAVTVRGFEVARNVALLAPAIRLDDNEGLVALEDIVATPMVALSEGTAVATARVSACARAFLTRCTLVGPQISTNHIFVPAEPTLRCTGSTVFVYDSSIAGSQGRHAGEFPSFGHQVASVTGAPAVQTTGGALFATGSSVRGGAGGNGYFWNETVCLPPSAGGTGLIAGGSVTLLDTEVIGGAGGVSAPGCPGTSSDGAATSITTGSIATIPQAARSYEVTSPIHEGQVATTTVTGQPGDVVVVLIGFAPGGTYVPALKGALFSGGPLTVVALGALPPSGVLSFGINVPVGLLPAAIDGIHLYEQAAVGLQNGTGLLSSPSAVTIVR